MKKVAVLVGILTLMILTGCSKSIDLGDLPLVDSAPIIIEEADANLVALANPIVITNADCGSSRCLVRVQFVNNGSKQARDLEYSFNQSSSAIDGTMTSGYRDILNQGETSTIDYTIYYSGSSMPNEKLGTIKVNYIKNGSGEKATANLDVIKQ